MADIAPHLADVILAPHKNPPRTEMRAAKSELERGTNPSVAKSHQDCEEQKQTAVTYCEPVELLRLILNQVPQHPQVRKNFIPRKLT